MSFEEWWNTKDYPVSCKGNCKEAYEAGMKADVHTDDSQVIAELEEQIEKMKCDVKQEQSYWNTCEMQYDLYQRLLDNWELKENE